MPDGARVHITTTNRDQILAATRSSFQHALDDFPKDSGGGGKPALALCISCAGRKQILGSRTQEEGRIVNELLGDVPAAGFYGYGEIARLAKDGISHYHNETFTTLLLGGRVRECVMETDDVGKLQKEIRSLKKQVERLEASRATFELMVDRNDKLLSRQLEQTQRQAEELNRINFLADSALDLTKCRLLARAATAPAGTTPSERAARILRRPAKPDGRYHLQDDWCRACPEADEASPRSRRRTTRRPRRHDHGTMTRPTRTSGRSTASGLDPCPGPGGEGRRAGSRPTCSA